MLGEFLRGTIEDDLEDDELLLWLRIEEDGTWAYGLRACSRGDAPSAEGDWEERDEATIELLPGADGFGALAGGSDPIVHVSQTADCQVVQLEDGQDTATFSRGEACMKGCSGNMRELYWCTEPPSCE